MDEERVTFKDVQSLLSPLGDRVIDTTVLCHSGTGYYYAMLHPDAVRKEKLEPLKTITRVTNNATHTQNFGWIVPLIVNGESTCCLFHRRYVEFGELLPVCFHGPSGLFHGNVFTEKPDSQIHFKRTLHRVEQLLKGETLQISFAKDVFQIQLGSLEEHPYAGKHLKEKKETKEIP